MAPSRRYFGRASSRFQRSSKSTLAPAVLLGVILLVQIYFAGALLATASSHLSSSASFYDLFHCVTSLGIAGVPFVAVHRDVVDNTTRPNLPVFVVVKTVPAAYERRAVMRETWLKELRATMRTGSHDIEYRFFSEEPSPSQQEDVQAECEKEGDLVIIHNVDQKAHRKIGVKMVRSFKWVVEKYNVSHVVMVDDDSYVNLKRFKGDWPTWGVCFSNLSSREYHTHLSRWRVRFARSAIHISCTLFSSNFGAYKLFPIFLICFVSWYFASTDYDALSRFPHAGHEGYQSSERTHPCWQVWRALPISGQCLASVRIWPILCVERGPIGAIYQPIFAAA